MLIVKNYLKDFNNISTCESIKYKVKSIFHFKQINVYLSKVKSIFLILNIFIINTMHNLGHYQQWNKNFLSVFLLT